MNDTALFVYGSLLVPRVRSRLLGRDVLAVPARLEDHERKGIKNEIYPALRHRPGARVSGELLLVSGRELARLDAYEGELYVRRPVTVVLADGTQRNAATYLIAPGFERRMTESDWSLEAYRRRL